MPCAVGTRPISLCGSPMTEPADQAARLRALDPASSFIVQAPAGSGKTEILAQRVLRLLAIAERPEDILAITFTRKAAGEMRERILSALAAAAEDQPVAKPHERQTRDLASAALRRDEQAGWHLLNNPSRLRVMTIDGLNAWLSQRLPVLSGLGGSAPIADRPEDLYREAARRCLLSADGHPARESARRLLEHLDNRYGRAEDLVVDLLGRRDHWLPRLGGQPGMEGDDARRRLEAGLGRVVEEGLGHAARALRGFEELGSLAAVAAEELTARGRASPVLACAGLSGLPGTRGRDLPVWQGLAELCLVKKPQVRKSFTVRDGVPPNRAEEKARLVELVAALGDEEQRVAALHAVRNLPPPIYEDGQWQILTALLDVLRYAAMELEVTFRQRRMTDYVGVARGGLEALGATDDPTDLALTLDHRLQHLLVDEFQDTSESQHELLRRLTAGWSAGDGRTLFCVGDPMQSIYRFRDAEVGLFLRTAETGLGGLHLEKLRLTANFRASADLVEWTNRIFSTLFPVEADLGSGAVPFSASDSTRPAAGSVQVHRVRADGGAGEAGRVADTVEALLGENRKETVGVLVRSRSQLTAIVSEFRNRSLPFRGVDIQPLSEAPVIQELLALTRAICHPADRVAWLACLRGPVCGLSLEILETLPPDRAVWSALADPEWRAGLDEPHRAMLAERVLPVLAAALEARGRLPLERVVESAWLALGGPAAHPDGRCLQDVATFLEFLRSACEAGDLGDPLTLQDRLGDLYAAPDPKADGRLEVMTIHKAKGLEFDHVVLPGLDRGVRAEKTPLIRWAERVTEHGLDLLLASVGQRGGDSDPVHDYLGGLEKRRAANERTRLLYVAATRARRSLHLIGQVRRNDDGSWASPPAGSFLGLLGPLIDPPEAVSQDQAPGSAPEVSAGLRRLPPRWRAPPPPPPIPALAGADAGPEERLEFDWAGRTARAVGIATHRLFELMGKEGLDAFVRHQGGGTRHFAAVLLQENGLTPAEAEQSAEWVAAAVDAVRDDPRGAWIFDTTHPRRWTEHAVTVRRDDEFRRLVADCLIEDAEGVLWIIDFKTGRHLGGDPEGFLDREVARYRPQLEAYAEAFGAAHEGPVRLALYYPLLRGWREWSWRD